MIFSNDLNIVLYITMGKASVMEAFRIYRIEIALANLYHFITYRIALFKIFFHHMNQISNPVSLCPHFHSFLRNFFVSISTRSSYSVLRHSERIPSNNHFTNLSVYLDTAAFTFSAMSFR